MIFFGTPRCENGPCVICDIGGTRVPVPRCSRMSWMRTTHEPASSSTSRVTEGMLADLHRGLLLASASHRLQDSISSQRATAEARALLTRVKTMCEQTPYTGTEQERIRRGIELLTQALNQN
jgi:hypothetical protein